MLQIIIFSALERICSLLAFNSYVIFNCYNYDDIIVYRYKITKALILIDKLKKNNDKTVKNS